MGNTMLSDLDEDQKHNFAFIGRCVKGLAHNVNTPLSAIMGRAEMLQMRLKKLQQQYNASAEPPELEKCMRDLTLIMDNSQRITDMMRNAMQKSISCENNTNQQIHIGTILKNELEFLFSDMDFKHNIEKSVQISEGMPAIEGSFVDFSNTFNELLDNSKKAVKESSLKKISVTAENTSDGIRIIIRDTGCGFQEDLRKEALRQLNRSEGSVETCSAGGFYRVARLMEPYSAHFDIKSSPGDTELSMHIPVSSG